MRYALLDVARLSYDLTTAQAINPNHVSLYRGSDDPQMTAMAPMLFWYEANDPFAHRAGELVETVLERRDERPAWDHDTAPAPD